MKNPKIYTASKCKHAAKWRDLRASGVNVISTWIDEAEPGQSPDLQSLASRCVSEAARADFVLLYCEPGEVLKGALIEAGAALAAGKCVRCVGTCENLSPVLRYHPGWFEFGSVAEALAA
jgi:hypothetical protein